MRRLSVEDVLYLVIFVAAILSRFWDLGAKALHHDESLHAYYSWQFATTGDYRHDPLMHGPFLFHANALVYLLFGDSDASSRYAPAFFGVLIVMMPFMLRAKEHLGRWGALSASFLLLVSPTILYQSRYIRHDVYTVAGSLLLFIAIVRYIQKPARRWLIVGSGSIAFLLTNHEIVFAILVIFGGYLYTAFIWGRLMALKDEQPKLAVALLGLHAGIVLALLALLALVPPTAMERILDIPWESPTAEQQRAYYSDLVSNPLILGGLAILVLFVLGHIMIARAAADPDVAAQDGWFEGLLYREPDGSLAGAVRNAALDRRGLWIALLVGGFIFVAFYTTMFTNLYGLVSSTVATDGTLLYWLGQHDYRRGEQPWFYFLLLAPQYEFVAALFGVSMAGLTIFRTIGYLSGRWDAGKNLFFRLFLVTWAVLIFAGLSYAGEKMPWLTVHIAEPFILLAAIPIGGLIERALDGRRVALPSGISFGRPEWSLSGTLLLAGAAWVVLAGRLSYGQFVSADQPGGETRTLTTNAAAHWWWLAIPPAVVLIAIGLAAASRGTRRTSLATLGALATALILLQIHGGWRLSYINPDVPDEMMVYTQTSPDVVRVMDEISQLSEETTGGNSLNIWFDSEVSWPMWWYLRNYSQYTFYGGNLTSTPDNEKGKADVILSAPNGGGGGQYLTNYSGTEYVLRWWFPEELYRGFALAPELGPGRSAYESSDQPHGLFDIVSSMFDSMRSLLKPDGQVHLYRLVMYRNLEQPMGSTNFTFYVRSDLVPLLNQIRY